ncbi:MAG TPA: VWA domain-containing protein [Ktedonobacterales bacterium]|nr:VWA domain-containing protein [Ktedonobacterales bacterium]
MPLFDRFRARKRYAYTRWDGTQQLDDLDSGAILDALSDDYLKRGNLREALERMMRQGFNRPDGQRQMGLRDLMERLRQQRQQRLQRYNMSGVMDDILKKLEHVKELEREGIQRRLDSARGGDQGQQGQQSQPQDGVDDQAGEQQAQGSEGGEGGEPRDGQQGQQGQQSQGKQSQGQQPQGQQGAQGQQGQRGQRGQMGQRGQSGQRGQQGQAGQSGQAGQQGGQQGGDSGQSGQSGTPEGMDPDALRRMLENIANKKLDFLDQLPGDPGGQIRQLSDYDFMDDQARQEFQELLEMLQQHVMQQYFQGMQQAIANMSPEDLARMREMVRALNQMLRERAEGGEPDFDSFMQQYGDFLGPGINTLDDLVEQMQRNMMAMQAVFDSMSAEQRQQLEEMMDQLIGDDRLRVDLAELARNLDMVAPSDARTQFRLSGDEPLSLAEAMHLMGVLQELDDLEHQMHEAQRSGDLDQIDPQRLRDLVGEDEAAALQELRDMLRKLEEDGLVERHGDRYELTARGIRRIGQKALEDIFAQMRRDGFGQHKLWERGHGGERTDETKGYTFGDPFHLHLERTVMNGVARGGAGTPVLLKPDDFEVYRTEHLTQSATVVMLDMSYSMLLNGLWTPAKKVAIALESLMRGQFPRDQLFVVGFGFLAREYKPEELIELSELESTQGTNMAYGLMLARQLLARTRSTNKQIIMVTDGLPTMCKQGDDWYFSFPNTELPELQTLREVRRCARDEIELNIFALSDDPYLKHFVNQMAVVNRGRAFYVEPTNLGEYVLIDYLNHRTKHVS